MKKLSPTMKINLLIIVIFTSIQGCDSRKPTNDFTDNTNTELQCKDNALSDSNLDKLYSLTDEGLAQNLVSIGKTCKIEQKNNEKYFAALEKYISKASPKDLIELYKKYDQNNLEFLRYELLSRSNVLKFTNNNSLLPLQYKAIEFNSLGTEISKANLDNKELANIKTLSDPEASDKRIVNSVKKRMLLQFTEFTGANSGTENVYLDDINNENYLKAILNDKDGSINRPDGRVLNIGAWGSGQNKATVALTEDGNLVGALSINDEMLIPSDGPILDAKCQYKVNTLLFFDEEKFNPKLTWMTDCDENHPSKIIWHEKLMKFLISQKQLVRIIDLVNFNRLDKSDILILRSLDDAGILGRSQMVDREVMHEKFKNEIHNIQEAQEFIETFGENLSQLKYVTENTKFKFRSTLAQVDKEYSELKDRFFSAKKIIANQALAKSVEEFRLYNAPITQQMKGPVTYNNELYPFAYESHINSGKITILVSKTNKFESKGFYLFYGRKIAQDIVQLNEKNGNFSQAVDVLELADNDQIEIIKSKRYGSTEIDGIIMNSNKLRINFLKKSLEIESIFVRE